MTLSQKGTFETVMFHYVRPNNDRDLPYLNSFDLDTFSNYVKQNKAKIFTQDDILSLSNDKCSKEITKTILLTFDDGLADHYRYVYSILKQYGVSGIFFINSKNIADGMMDSVHKLHYLYGRLGWARLVPIIQNLAVSKKIDLSRYYTIQLATEAYELDEIEVACIKYALNHSMEQEARESFIDEVFNANFPMLDQASFYLSGANIQEMTLHGMVFGYHGHEHLPFASLTSEEVIKSISMQNKLFDQLSLERPSVLSFPYGDKSSYSISNLETLSLCGISYAFSSDNFSIAGLSVRMLPRKDCTEILS